MLQLLAGTVEVVGREVGELRKDVLSVVVVVEEYARTELTLKRGAEADILIHAADGRERMQAVGVLRYADVLSDDAALLLSGCVETLDKRLADHHLAQVAVGRLGEVAAFYDFDAHELQVAVAHTVLVGNVEVFRVVARQVDIITTMPLDGQRVRRCHLLDEGQRAQRRHGLLHLVDRCFVQGDDGKTAVVVAHILVRHLVVLLLDDGKQAEHDGDDEKLHRQHDEFPAAACLVHTTESSCHRHLIIYIARHKTTDEDDEQADETEYP